MVLALPPNLISNKTVSVLISLPHSLVFPFFPSPVHPIPDFSSISSRASLPYLPCYHLLFCCDRTTTDILWFFFISFRAGFSYIFFHKFQSWFQLHFFFISFRADFSYIFFHKFQSWFQLHFVFISFGVFARSCVF